LIAIALVAIGCGGNAIKIDDLKDQNVSSSCERLARCGFVSSYDTCVALIGAKDTDLERVQAGVENGAIGYDGDKAGDCLDAMAGASCDASAKDTRVEPQACKDAIKGNRKQGEACFFSLECATGICNLPSTCDQACCAGSCAPQGPTPAAIGQACTAGPCVDGAYCKSGTCAALIAAGQTCESNAQCDYGLVCGGNVTRTCVKAPKEGDPCPNGGGGSCYVLGLACDATDHCAKLLGKGAACSPTDSLCAADLTCDATTKICTALPTTGQPCTGGCVGGYCDRPTLGGAGTCKAAQPDGAACTVSDGCESGHCDTSSQKCVRDPVCA
jgi:hypothetical protein